MKKLKLFIISITLLTTTAWALERETPVRTIETVKIYQGASTNSKVIATLPKDSPLLVAKNYNGNGWLHVKPKDKKASSWKSGWIQFDRVVSTKGNKKGGKGKGKGKGKK